jgi:uncharacterized membrane protein
MSKAESFTVTLTPHRSLTREGFYALIAVVAGINLVGSVLFLVAGAWPIVGFMGLDVALVWWAFRQNFADARQSERISVNGDEVVLERFASDGLVSKLDFNRRWVKVELEVDADRELVGRLLLRSHGKTHEIAAFLGAEERQSLAKALRQSL